MHGFRNQLAKEVPLSLTAVYVQTGHAGFVLIQEEVCRVTGEIESIPSIP